MDTNDFELFDTCESCIKGKMTKVTFVGHEERASNVLGLVHTDVCGPMTIHARGGYSYFITFTNEFSRYGYVFLMKHKSEAFEKFKEFKNEVENQMDKSIKILRSDRGEEYLSYEFLDYLKAHGIVSQWTPPTTPQLNGVSERRNRTLLDMVRSMMSFADLSTSFWGYALETANYLLNRVPTKSVLRTPYEIWKNKKPDFKYVKVWGCPAFVKKLNPDKLDSRSVKCRFVGYPRESVGYQFYHAEEQRVFVSKHAIFLEKEFLVEEYSKQKRELEKIYEPQPTITRLEESVQEKVNTQIRRSTRISRPPERYVGHIDQGGYKIYLMSDEDPKTYEEAIANIDSKKWLDAMQSEMDSMYHNQVWTLVDAPEGIVLIGYKWVFKRKTGVTGEVESYKARLVAKGYR